MKKTEITKKLLALGLLCIAMLTSVGCESSNDSSSEIDSESAVTTTLENEEETTLTDEITEQETTLDDIEEDSTTQQESEQFIAQGNTTLYNFLDAASSNGYSIENPQKDDVYVNAVATGNGGTFNICYMVEEQHAYMVEVFADDLMSDGFKDCVRAMALALNPNISDDGLEEAINYVLDCTDESYVIEDTLFRFDSTDNKLVITY
ncbi:MAG: hypothetical protein LIO41_01265 [Ruminococcus sp.]|nr:hypothetical protein [Ruminococcus sp.]